MAFTLLLPTSVPLAPVVPDGVRIATYCPDRPLPEDVLDAQGLVVWGNSDAQLRDSAQRLRSVRWVQTLAAGPDQVLDAGFAPDVVVTSGRSLHDTTVAEHTLALCLAAARRLHTLTRAQIGHRWASELGGPQPLHEPDSFRTLRDARVLIWGFGSIATTLAPHLTALGARVTGAASRAGTRGGYPVVGPDGVDRALAETDLLIMILPSTPATRHVLDAERIALLPRHAWVVNVGRGSTIDTEALVAALRAERLGGAALDVFESEPLETDSPFWDEPDVIITPHGAGGRPLGADELIAQNVAALLQGTPLRNVVSADGSAANRSSGSDILS